MIANYILLLISYAGFLTPLYAYFACVTVVSLIYEHLLFSVFGNKCYPSGHRCGVHLVVLCHL